MQSKNNKEKKKERNKRVENENRIQFVPNKKS